MKYSSASMRTSMRKQSQTIIKQGNNGELNHSMSLTPRILYDVHLSKYCTSPNAKRLRIEGESVFPVGVLREKDLEENASSHCEL